ncbi:MAG: hypothetical protein ABI626_01370 [Sphingomicrobium sp.]
MSETPEQRRRRLRWLTLGEVLAVVAVAISALGLWKTWNGDERPTTVVEQRRPISLTLRGKAADDGRTLEISAVEPGHALQSLAVRLPGSKTAISVASDGALSASDVEGALGKTSDHAKGTQRQPVRIQADYVEAGVMRHASGNYVLAYRWEGGGLFGGRSLRLTGFSRG